jgi:hypothetical protein
MPSPQFNPRPGRAGTVRPALEALEDRTCPSAVTLQGHTLLVSGDPLDNRITIQDSGNGTVRATVVDDNGHQSALTAGSVEAIEVNTGDGDDTIAYSLAGPLTQAEKIAIRLGQGDNQTELDFSQAALNAELDVTVRTGNGDNQVDALFGAVAGARVNLQTYLGDGFNQFKTQLNGPVTGNSAVSVYGDTGQGFSGLNFSEQGDIAAGSQVAVNFQGGASSDTFHTDYAGRLDGQLTLGVTGGPSGNWIASEVNLAAGSTGTLNADFNSGAGDDVFLVQVLDQSGRLQASNVAIDGGAGNNMGIISPENVSISHVALD